MTRDTFQSYIERLKQIREEKALSYADIAEALTISEQCLVMIEIGELVPTTAQQEAIMEFVINQV